MSIRPARSVLWAVTAVVLLWVANLFLGSVRIPFAEVWAVLTGGEASQPSWGYIVLESRLAAGGRGSAVRRCTGRFGPDVANRVQQSAGRSVGARNRFRSQSGRGFGHAVARGNGRRRSRADGLSGRRGRGFCRSCVDFGYHHLLLDARAQQRDAAHYRHYGRLPDFLADFIAEFLRNGRGHPFVRIVGNGRLFECLARQLPVFYSMLGIGLLLAALLVKPLNALLLGERYAENLGVRVKRVRLLLLVSTGLLTAVVTAFCGPISFIGLAVPHLARLMTGSSNHKLLMPLTLLTGSAVALACNLVSTLPGGSGVLPLSAITPVVGAPVIIYVIVNQKRIQYFN